MDRTFWIGLILGGAISIIASIGANIYTPKFLQYRADKRNRRSLRSKWSAHHELRLLTALKSGKRDRHLFFLANLAGMLLLALIGSTLLIISAVMLGWYLQRTMVDYGWIAIVFFVGCLFYYWSLRLFAKTDDRRRRLENFEDYKSKTIAQYGAPKE